MDLSVCAEAARAELSSVARLPVGAALVGAVALGLLGLVADDGGGGLATTLTWRAAAALVAATVGALDGLGDPTAAAAPTPYGVRLGVRLSAGAVAVVVWLLLAVLHTGSALALVTVGLALVVSAAAVTAMLVRAGHAEPGSAVAASYVVLVLGLLVVPFPGEVRPLDVSAADGTTACWALLALTGGAVLHRLAAGVRP